MAGNEKNILLLCTNSDCSNDRIAEYTELTGYTGPRRCPFCNQELNGIIINSPASGSKMIVEKELSNRSRTLDWLDMHEVNRWPGPIAFEYNRFNEIMSGGNIEAACWKIANLAEIITSYLLAAALEQHSISQKINALNKNKNKTKEIKNYFQNNYLYNLLDTLRDNMRWRNKFGVGHGTLAQNRESYIENLLFYGKQLNDCLSKFNQFLHRYNMSLQNQNGEYLTGTDYFSKLKNNHWNVKIYCNNPARPVKNKSQPLRIFGCQFDSPDIYFLDSFNKGVLTYRNFRRNNIKLIKDGKISWKDEPGQVSWLNPAEYKSWKQYLKNNSRDTRLKEILLDAAEQFQERGMSNEAMWCIKNYEKLYQDSNPGHNLRLQMTKYNLNASPGNENQARTALDKALKLASSIKDKEQQIIYYLNINLNQSWHKGVYGKINEALHICDQAIKDIQPLKEKYPFLLPGESWSLKKITCTSPGGWPRNRETTKSFVTNALKFFRQRANYT